MQIDAEEQKTLPSTRLSRRLLETRFAPLQLLPRLWACRPNKAPRQTRQRRTLRRKRRRRRPAQAQRRGGDSWAKLNSLPRLAVVPPIARGTMRRGDRAGLGTRKRRASNRSGRVASHSVGRPAEGDGFLYAFTLPRCYSSAVECVPIQGAPTLRGFFVRCAALRQQGKVHGERRYDKIALGFGTQV